MTIIITRILTIKGLMAQRIYRPPAFLSVLCQTMRAIAAVWSALMARSVIRVSFAGGQLAICAGRQMLPVFAQQFRKCVRKIIVLFADVTARLIAMNVQPMRAA